MKLKIEKVIKNKEDKKKNYLNFEKFKIKRIRCSQVEYKEKINAIVNKLLINTYKVKTDRKNYFDDNEKNSYYLNIKKIIKPTPYQIYEKIKLQKKKKILKKRENKYEHLSLSLINKSSFNSTNNYNSKVFSIGNNFKNGNVFKKNFFSQIKKRILKCNNFYTKKSELTDSSNNFTEFSKLIIKNDLIKNNNNNDIYNGKNIIERNDINKFKTKSNFYKKLILNHENSSFLYLRNNHNLENFPKINRNIYQIYKNLTFRKENRESSFNL